LLLFPPIAGGESRDGRVIPHPGFSGTGIADQKWVIMIREVIPINASKDRTNKGKLGIWWFPS